MRVQGRIGSLGPKTGPYRVFGRMPGAGGFLYTAVAMKIISLACGLSLAGGAAAADPAAFKPSDAPYGHFGGEAPCSTDSDKTPVVFVHGNANSVKDWDAVQADYQAAGYDRCRLYGVTWLSAQERQTPVDIAHTARRAQIVRDFIRDVRRHTGSEKVDVVAHSMGVTLALAAIDSGGMWTGVRKFVAVAGAMRGLGLCRQSPLKTCGGQQAADSQEFGFLPEDAPPADPQQGPNWRMGDKGFRAMPRGAPQTRFYALSAGAGDEVLCMAPAAPGCETTALFDPAPNVAAPVVEAMPGGATWRHFQIRDLTGALQVRLLQGQ